MYDRDISESFSHLSQPEFFHDVFFVRCNHRSTCRSQSSKVLLLVSGVIMESFDISVTLKIRVSDGSLSVDCSCLQLGTKWALSHALKSELTWEMLTNSFACSSSRGMKQAMSHVIELEQV